MTITKNSRAADLHSAPSNGTPREASTRPAVGESTTKVRTPVGQDSRAARDIAETEPWSLRESNSRTAVTETTPTTPSPSGPNSRPADYSPTPSPQAPVGSDSRATSVDTAPISPTSREPNSHATNGQTMSDRLPSRGSNVPEAGWAPLPGWAAPQGSDVPDPAANPNAAPIQVPLLDPALALAADFLDDVERVKIANENRLRALTRAETDADGVDRYIGLDASHPVVAQLAAMVESLSQVEHAAVLNLQRMLRKHPLHGWVKAQRGVGEKQAARLLAVIGDPYWRPEITRADGTIGPEGPRTVSALWAYCGLHVLPAVGQSQADTQGGRAGGGDISAGGDSSQTAYDDHLSVAGVAARRRKGQQANWSTTAKTRAYLIAESCLKQLVKPCHNPGDGIGVHVEDCACSPYRVVYDRRKAHTSLTRPEWTDGHRHADALRVASKEILKGLWRAAREHHLKGRAA